MTFVYVLHCMLLIILPVMLPVYAAYLFLFYCCMCICIYIYIYMYILKILYWIFACMHVCMYVCIYIHMYAYTCIHQNTNQYWQILTYIWQNINQYWPNIDNKCQFLTKNTHFSKKACCFFLEKKSACGKPET